MVNGGAIDVFSDPLYSADDPCTGVGFVFNFTLNISSDTEGNYSAYFVNEVGDLATEEVLVTSEGMCISDRGQSTKPMFIWSWTVYKTYVYLIVDSLQKLYLFVVW